MKKPRINGALRHFQRCICKQMQSPEMACSNQEMRGKSIFFPGVEGGNKGE